MVFIRDIFGFRKHKTTNTDDPYKASVLVSALVIGLRYIYGCNLIYTVYTFCCALQMKQLSTERSTERSTLQERKSIPPVSCQTVSASPLIVAGNLPVPAAMSQHERHMNVTT